MTLEALAGFYGLNPDFVVGLADGESGQKLLRHLRQQVEESLGAGVADALRDVDDEATELAMRLARLSGGRADALSPERNRAQLVISFLRSTGERSLSEHAEVVDAFVDFLALDPSRRSVASQVLRDMRSAHERPLEDA